MDNNKISAYLKELASFRQKEILEMQQEGCDMKLLSSYANRTQTILKTAQALRAEASEKADVPQHEPQSSKELDELKAKYNAAVQMCADFENYKKRMQRQLADTASSANKGILEELLKVVDDFERVQDSMRRYESDPVIEGIKLIYANLMKVLNNEGCTKLDCKPGDAFDVNFHEAVASLPQAEDEGGVTVAQVMQTGWMLNGSLLRAAKVVVRQ